MRRMRWFRTAFDSYIAALGVRIGCVYKIDEAKLARIFVRWLAMELQQHRHHALSAERLRALIFAAHIQRLNFQTTNRFFPTADTLNAALSDEADA